LETKPPPPPQLPPITVARRDLDFRAWVYLSIVGQEYLKAKRKWA